MSDLLKNAMYAGLGLAVVTREKAEKLFDELVEKGKNYQEKNKTEEQEEVEAESVEDKEDPSKHNFFEEYEQKLRKLIENALPKFSFVKNDEHERIAKRIEALEEKLTDLADAAISKKQEKKEKNA